MEASTIPATTSLARQRGQFVAGPLLRLRSDEQLVRLFRSGSEEAFRVIHDRYRARLFAYARQMLSGSRHDAEDALQDVFVRAYAALRASDRDISLKAWLYRVAHNRCIDELRRPAPPPPEAFELIRPPTNDPIAATEQRESLRRLVDDVRRLPEQQRSALLMREIVGMPYQDLAAALDVTVPAVKSLLVRARIGLAQAAEARDTTCIEIRGGLADAHERGVRASGLARRHLHDCDDCRAYRKELRATRQRFAALTPALGPGALLAKLLGLGGGGAAGGGAASGSATASGVGVALGGGAGSVSATHVVAAVAAAVVGAGGAVEVQQTLVAPHRHAPPASAIVRHHQATIAPQLLATPRGALVVVPAVTHPHARAVHLHVTRPTDSAAPPPWTAANRNGGAAAPIDPTPASESADTPATAEATMPAVPATDADPSSAPTDGTTATDGATTQSETAAAAPSTSTQSPPATSAASPPESGTTGGASPPGANTASSAH